MAGRGDHAQGSVGVPTSEVLRSDIVGLYTVEAQRGPPRVPVVSSWEGTLPAPRGASPPQSLNTGPGCCGWRAWHWAYLA